MSGVRLVTETDRGRFVLMTGQRVSAPQSVSDEDSLGAEWSMEQPWHQLSSPLLISNLAPLETRVLNQSTNGLHLSLSQSRDRDFRIIPPHFARCQNILMI